MRGTMQRSHARAFAVERPARRDYGLPHGQGCFDPLHAGVTVRKPACKVVGCLDRRDRGATVSELFLVVLALVWAALLVPGAFRARKASPHTTVGGFERAMDVLRSDTRPQLGREVMVPGDASRIVDGPAGTEASAGPSSDPGSAPPRQPQEDPVVARRRFWFTRSLIGTAATLVLALLGGGGWLWVPFGVSLVLTAGYVAVLRHLKLQRDEAKRVVADLDLHRDDEVVIDVAAAEAGGGGAWSGSGTVRLRRWDD